MDHYANCILKIVSLQAEKAEVSIAGSTGTTTFYLDAGDSVALGLEYDAVLFEQQLRKYMAERPKASLWDCIRGRIVHA